LDARVPQNRAAAMTNRTAPVVFAMERARQLKILGVRRSTVLTLTFILSYVLYLVAGGFVFSHIEGPEEDLWRNHLNAKKSQFLANYSTIKGAGKNDTERYLKKV
jgi:lysylphosphatidylglycerol synthetase-like protein (DUF2156 family)